MDVLTDLLGLLRALTVLYQTEHWQAAGPSAHADHLLFGRLYATVVPEVDALGEKLVGLFNPSLVDALAVTEAQERFLEGWSDDLSPFSRGLLAETDLQRLIQGILAAAEGAEGTALPVGFDNFLRAMVDTHDTNVYLLKQRARPMFSDVVAATRRAGIPAVAPDVD